MEIDVIKKKKATKTIENEWKKEGECIKQKDGSR